MDWRYFDYWKKKISNHYDLDVSFLDKQFEIWATKFGKTDRSKSDFIWSIFNSIVNNMPSKYKTIQSLYHNLWRVYMDMWEFLIKENRNANHIIKLAHHCQLMNAENDDFIMRAEVIGGCCCKECEKINGQRQLIEDELKNQTLPYKFCTRELGCNCTYGFFADRDLSDKLILKNKPKK